MRMAITDLARFTLLASWAASVSFAQDGGLLPEAGDELRTFPDCSTGPLGENGICDTSLDSVDRARALVAVMALDQKINNSQNAASGVPELGLPAYNWWNEALHGVADSRGVSFAAPGEDFGHATSFPMPINLGASFDDDLVFEVATAISIESRAFANAGRAGLDFWTPDINPFKDPRWGRGQETPGEDAFHTGRYVYRLIDGLQDGIGPENPRIVATCKHFSAYDIEDWQGNERHSFDAIVSQQDLAEYYMPPFKRCVRDAKVDAVMCSYNSLNGIPTCADPYLLQTILREHWGWEAPGHWVTGDCNALENIYADHNYTETGAEAAAVALNAGTDLDCGTVYPEFLQESYDQGLFEEEKLDQALTRLYTSLVKLGYFDPAEGQPYRSIAWQDVATPEAEELAHTAAVKGMVLLKNNNDFLPLEKGSGEEGPTLALIGPFGNATIQMQGIYNGIPPYIQTLEWAATEVGGYNTHFVAGTAVDSDNSDGFAEAVEAAEQADIIIFAGGLDNTTEAEAHDRDSITWPGNQLQLIQELATVEDKPLIVVQFGGGQVDDSELLADDGVDAILWAGYPSQVGGSAVFDILTGTVAPAGRLPITQYPAEYAANVPMTDMNLRPSGESNPGRTYRWYQDAVLPFGFGLHYTTFDVSPPKSELGPYDTTELAQQASGEQVGDSNTADIAPFETITLSVSNTGDVVSDYVALLFLKTTDAGPEPYPLQTLVGYTRASQIQSGESQDIEVEVALGEIARTSETGDLVLYPGQYELFVDVGNSQTSVAKFMLEGQEEVLDRFPQRETEE